MTQPRHIHAEGVAQWELINALREATDLLEMEFSQTEGTGRQTLLKCRGVLARATSAKSDQSALPRRAETIQSALTELKTTAARIGQTIIDPDAKEFLLQSAERSLHDVETFLLPQGLKAAISAHAAMWFDAADFQLRSANQTVIHAQDLVAKHGPNLRIAGG